MTCSDCLDDRFALFGGFGLSLISMALLLGGLAIAIAQSFLKPAVGSNSRIKLNAMNVWLGALALITGMVVLLTMAVKGCYDCPSPGILLTFGIVASIANTVLAIVLVVVPAFKLRRDLQARNRNFRGADKAEV